MYINVDSYFVDALILKSQMLKTIVLLLLLLLLRLLLYNNTYQSWIVKIYCVVSLPWLRSKSMLWNHGYVLDVHTIHVWTIFVLDHFDHLDRLLLDVTLFLFFVLEINSDPYQMVQVHTCTMIERLKNVVMVR